MINRQPGFLERKDRQGVDLSRLQPGRHHLEAVGGVVLEQHLRHLGTGRVAGADEQDAGLFRTMGHSASPCGANSWA